MGGHSHAHFLATAHSYTMELGASRVWDYVGDNFVHRLMQTDSANGKLVEARWVTLLNLAGFLNSCAYRTFIFRFF